MTLEMHDMSRDRHKNVGELNKLMKSHQIIHVLHSNHPIVSPYLLEQAQLNSSR